MICKFPRPRWEYDLPPEAYDEVVEKDSSCS